MKTINNSIILLIAFTLAIGSAFSTNSALTLKDAYVDVQFVNAGPWFCVDSTKDCDDPNGPTCNITVPTTFGNMTVKGKKAQTACTTLLTHSVATAQVAPFMVYDAH